MQNKIKMLHVRDLNLASLLKAKGYKFHEVEWEGNVAYFLFEDKQNQGDRLIQKYLNGRVTGNLKKFADAQRTLKNILFSNK